MYNKVIIIGRLTATELHKTANDKSVARATVAVNRRASQNGGVKRIYQPCCLGALG